MVVWKSFEPNASEKWDNALSELDGVNPYQSFVWGEMKAQAGWSVLRLVAVDNTNKVIAAGQILVKKLCPMVYIFWCPGGPVGDVEAFDDDLIGALKSKTGAKVWFVRISALQPRTPERVIALFAGGWKQALYRINTGLSMMLPLGNSSIEKILAESSGNWRHNYKRGLKQNLTIQEWTDPNPEEIFAVYQKMQTFKDLKEQFPISQIKGMLDQFKGNLFVFRGLDTNNEVLALRGYVRMGNKAWDLFAASKPEARKVYATYTILGFLLNHASINGCQTYDLSGIDPQQNAGVYFFKKGTGAVPIEFLGEWDRYSHPIFALAVNFLLRMRNNLT